MFWFYVLIFLLSCLALALSSKWLIDALVKIAKFLGWKEFVVGFFIMAVATSIPNLFIGIISAANKIPELALGDIVGANIFDLTFVVAISAFLSKVGLSSKSRTVQGSAIFTMLIAALPVLLALDGLISRTDGILLIAFFFFYIFWIFGKRERFVKEYDNKEPVKFSDFFKDIGIFIVAVIFLLLAAEGFVKSAMFFAKNFDIPLALVGMLIIGIGSSLPEAIFSWHAARKGQDWLLLGNLMGGVIIVATLILGIIVLISPIRVDNFSQFAVARFFLVIAAISFLYCVRTHDKVTRKEGLFLLAVYLSFFVAELLIK